MKAVPVAAGNITIHIVKGQISKQKVAIPYVVLFNLCLRCMYMYTCIHKHLLCLIKINAVFISMAEGMPQFHPYMYLPK